MLTRDFWAVGSEESTGFVDDDELEELQCLLWRGYIPAAHVRTWYGPYEDHHRVDPRVGGRTPSYTKYKKAAERRKLFGRFECGRCGQWFYSSAPEDEVDAEFVAQFGEAAMAKRVAVCEGCFDVLVGEKEARH